MLFEDYKLEIIGKRGFSEIFKGTKEGSQDCFIVKILKKDYRSEVAFNVIVEGLQVLKDVNHSNIIKLLEIKEDSNYYYCICEYFYGENFFDYLKKRESKILSEEIVQYIMKQLISAIKYLHDKKIVHRNIKPSTIYINYGTKNDLLDKNILNSKIILAGFEVSTHLKKGESLNLPLGTKNYMAPEILKKMEYNEKVDIWSLGVIFCDLIKNLSKEASSFIDCMLQEDPNKRKTAEELLEQDFIVKDIKDFHKNI